MISKGKAESGVAPHVKPTEAASALLASWIGLSVLNRSRPERALLQTLVDDVLWRLAVADLLEMPMFKVPAAICPYETATST